MVRYDLLGFRCVRSRRSGRCRWSSRIYRVLDDVSGFSRRVFGGVSRFFSGGLRGVRFSLCCLRVGNCRCGLLIGFHRFLAGVLGSITSFFGGLFGVSD